MCRRNGGNCDEDYNKGDRCCVKRNRGDFREDPSVTVEEEDHYIGSLIPNNSMPRAYFAEDTVSLD